MSKNLLDSANPSQLLGLSFINFWLKQSSLVQASTFFIAAPPPASERISLVTSLCSDCPPCRFFNARRHVLPRSTGRCSMWCEGGCNIRRWCTINAFYKTRCKWCSLNILVPPFFQWFRSTGLGLEVDPRWLHECSRQGQAEVVSNKSNKIH